jgi:hypothetical protein
MLARSFSVASALLAAAVSIAVLVGCKPETSAPAPAPAPTAEAPHRGFVANFAPDLGAYVVEAEPVVAWQKGADTLLSADAAVPVGEFAARVIGPGPAQIALSKCQFFPAAGVTSSDSAYATINVYKRTLPQADGGTTQTKVATQLTKTAADGGSGDWVAWQAVSLQVVSGAFVSPGDVLTIETTKTGAGVSLPAGALSCFTDYR